jgi:class 3 adenylate cyclase
MIMARFACECNLKMDEISPQLETMFGPDTAELALRIGLHSGPVIGGVLRGENARFHLFGAVMVSCDLSVRLGVWNVSNHSHH